MPTIERLREAASDRFRALRVSSREKRLTIVVAGFLYENDGARWFAALISHFEEFDDRAGDADTVPSLDLPEAKREFASFIYRAPSTTRGAGLLCGGMGHLVSRVHVDRVLAVVEGDRPAEALVNKAMEVLREVADLPAARKAVSKDCMTVVLPRDPSVSPEGHFRPLHGVTHKLVWPSRIEGRSGVPPLPITDIEITFRGTAAVSLESK